MIMFRLVKNGAYVRTFANSMKYSYVSASDVRLDWALQGALG